jgi:hypothetical protein
MGLTRPRAHQLQETSFKSACRVISTSNITLSGGAPATVDGVSVQQGDRVLVIGQSTGAENGIYNVATVGSGSNGTWNRTKDADGANDITAGITIMVTEGSTYADSSWKLTTDNPITIGSTALTFEQASAYSFGTISANGTSIVSDSVGDTVTLASGNNIVITGNATSDTVTFATSDTPSFTGNVSTDAYFIGDGSQLTNLASTSFSTIAVTGQSNIVADSGSDTLTFTAGAGITITTDAGADSLTIAAGTADFPFAQDTDFESVTDDPASTTEDLGDLASTNEVTYDLGTIISAEGLIYPGQLVLPQYTTASLPDANVEGQLAYDTDENAVKFTDGTQWSGYAGLASPTFTGTVTATAFSGDGSALTGIESLPDAITVNGSAASGTLAIDASSNTTFTGDVTVTGEMSAATITETSTMRIKENINPISNGLDAILNLTGVTYDRLDNHKHEAGLIAEQVNEILPDLVAKDEEGKPSAIQYTKLTAYLIEAVKSLKAEIDELKRKH